YAIQTYVVVVLMPLSGSPMESVEPPAPERVAEFLVQARLKYPKLRASLGCARPRGRYKRRLDMLAIDAGVNSIALPSDAALEYAAQRGLEVVFREWCCSLG
ncbi:MAG: radical SAM protein, partial [Desulfomonilaceae bacterium]